MAAVYISPEATEYKHLIYEVDNEHVCWLTLNRPEKRNALNRLMVGELKAGLLRAEADDNVNVVVIRGAGSGFCAGHDLVEDAHDEWKTPFDYRTHYIEQLDDFITPWLISKPVIASVHGFAIGKGFELTLFSDVSIVTTDVVMGYKEFRFGGSGHSVFLPYLVNMRTAKELFFTGREVPALEAKQLGLATKVVEPEELEEATRKMATLMARMPNDLQRVHKTFLNRTYEMQNIKLSAAYYEELVGFMGAAPPPEVEEFLTMTRELGLKKALAHANARYAEFEDD